MSTSQFYFKTTESEHIETTIHMRPESKCTIVGRVKSQEGLPVVDAAVLLFEGRQPEKLISRAFTDEDGVFCFGPLEKDILHNIRIYKDNTKIRELEIKTEV